jgi:hypothetical protein
MDMVLTTVVPDVVNTAFSIMGALSAAVKLERV